MSDMEHKEKMIYLLFGLMLGILVVYLWWTDDLASPVALMLSSFVLALFAILLNVVDWEVEISPLLVAYIALVLISFSFGYRFAQIFKRKAAFKKSEVNLDYKYPAWALAVASVVCCIFYLWQVLEQIELTGDMPSMLREIYDSGASGGSNFLLHQPFEIVIAIAHISVFELFMQLLTDRSRSHFLATLVPLVSFAVCFIISTDRNVFIRFALYSWCLWVMFYRYRNPGKRRKVYSYSLLAVAVAIVAFFALGKAKAYTSDFHRMFGIYAGSGLYNFNLTISSGEITTLHYGGCTFSTLTNTLNSLGLLPSDLVTQRGHGEFIIHKAQTGYVYASNIYSSMMPYVDDFGYLGVVIFPLALGLFYGTLYSIAREIAFGYGWFLYALLMYPLIYFTIQEQFFWRLHLGLLYEVGWATLIFVLVYNKKASMAVAFQVEK